MTQAYSLQKDGFVSAYIGAWVKTSDGGFALLEAIVAMIACSMVLTLFFEVIGRSAAVSQITSDRFAATLFAQSTFDGLGTLTPLETGTTRGTFGGLFHWVLHISDASGADAAAGGVPLKPVDIAVRIEWERGGRHERVEYKTLRLVRSP